MSTHIYQEQDILFKFMILKLIGKIS